MADISKIAVPINGKTTEFNLKDDEARRKLVEMAGATSSADGTSGLVPAPTVDDIDKFLRGDGTWGTLDSSGKGYQMPYYVQSGTLSVNLRYGLQNTITFPKKYKSAPLMLVSISEYGHDNSYPHAFCATKDITESGATLDCWATSNSGSHLYSDRYAIINWVALGEPED